MQAKAHPTRSQVVSDNDVWHYLHLINFFLMLTDAGSCYTTSHYQASGICYKNYQNESQPNILFDSLNT